MSTKRGRGPSELLLMAVLIGCVCFDTRAVESSPHWAFQPPKRWPVPAVQNAEWPRAPIDFFILAQLEEKGLRPSRPADKRTLIRRASFDLTGLPPAAEEVAAFLRDDSPEAFARVVDRLLASPAYGERWGRYWLDVARYADTKGYVYSDREEARFVHSYVYRDWVIRAFNSDMPYDQFLMQQIAGDYLQNETSDSALAAMGFITLGRRFLGVAHDIIDDRIDTVMRGTQALTVACARCHDHKFDPIPITDYYSLYGVFAGSTERMAPVTSMAQSKEPSDAFKRGLQERVDQYTETFKKRSDEFSNRFRVKAKEYLVAVLDVKKLPTEEHYEIRGPDDLNPTVVRSWESYLLQSRAGFDPVFGPWHALQAIPEDHFEAEAARALADLSAAGSTSPDQSNRVNRRVLRVLREKPVTSMRDVAERYGLLLVQAHEQWQRLLQEASANQLPAPTVLPEAELEQLREVLYGVNSPVRIPPGLAAGDLEWYFDEKTRVELMKLHAEIERWIIKSGDSPPYAVVLQDRAVQKNARVFLRGNPANKGAEVPRQFISALKPWVRQDPFQVGSGRLELAKAIASRENPLTARVMVNRVWAHHFGTGLVRTASDFGTRSEPPTHPELLDWLAFYFMDHQWSLKKLHRLILLSSVYQQNSEGSERPDPGSDASSSRAAQIDPENRLLWRMNRSRLDFEALRDSMLAVTGELERSMGGPPADLFKQPFNKRRTVYGLIDRQFLPGVFRVFDFANPDMHTPQRPETTVPQQALFFMNSPFVVERARALAVRSEQSNSIDPANRIQRLYESVYQRPATPQQVRLGMEFVRVAEEEPVYTPPPPPPSAWWYGYGEFSADSKRLENFQLLPHFTGDAWQGGEKWPDEKLGWVRLTSEGGHAGNDLKHAAVRRWVSPVSGKINVNAVLHHEHEAGDGVRGRLVSSRHGVLGEWTVHKNKAETKVEGIAVVKGDTLDFVVDLNANLNSDDFQWNPTIQVVETAAPERSSDFRKQWNAKKDFSGPPPEPPPPLKPWEKYAQVLLLSNEFMFVD